MLPGHWPRPSSPWNWRTLPGTPGREPTAGTGPVIDAEAFAVERLAVQALDPDQRRNFVRRQLGALLDHDAQRNSRLLDTLATWLDCGCNTAHAARELHVERQSMHQRLRRIFELCGGDPRDTGRLAALHLAARLAEARLTLPPARAGC